MTGTRRLHAIGSSPRRTSYPRAQDGVDACALVAGSKDNASGSTTTTPCRLFVIQVASAPAAVVLRRGPSRWSQVVAWDTHRDTFTPGAWFKGRTYEDRYDVSPDGELLLYFCHGGRRRPGYTDSWTAVSRLPWLHALALWPWGTTYGGGGRFTSKPELVLRTGMAFKPHHDHLPTGLQVPLGSPQLHRSTGEPGTDWSGVDHARLVFCRDGKLFRRTRAGVDRGSKAAAVVRFASAVASSHTGGARDRRAGRLWDAFWGQRYACVLDPEGNQVDLLA